MKELPTFVLKLVEEEEEKTYVKLAGHKVAISRAKQKAKQRQQTE